MGFTSCATGGLGCNDPSTCQGCGGPLLEENVRIADGCPCNAPRGVNHGLVSKATCTCLECDPAQTGHARALHATVTTK